MSHDLHSPSLPRRLPRRPSLSVPMDSSVSSEPLATQKPREDAATRAARMKAVSRIEEVIQAAGVRLTPVGHGHRLVGLCPFHAEEHASFTVYPDTQSFCCYGCHAAGDVITFVCLFQNVRFEEALRFLGEVREERTMPSPCHAPATSLVSSAALLHFPRPATGAPPARLPLSLVEAAGSASADVIGTRPSTSLPRGEEERDGTVPDVVRAALLNATTALAMQGLLHAARALIYLGERGISLELARRCRLGYLEDVALLDFLAGDRALCLAAQQIGLINRRQHVALSRRLIVPEVRQGRTTQLIGRTLPDVRTPLRDIKYYLVCDGEKGVLGYGAACERLARIRAQQLVGTSAHGSMPRPRGILVAEGALDYVIASGWDLPVLSVALLSAYPSHTQLRELLDLQTCSGDLPLLVLLDADGTGQEASAYLRRALRERRVPYRVLPPLPRLPMASAAYKDLGELGPLGQAGRLHVLAAVEQALEQRIEQPSDAD